MTVFLQATVKEVVLSSSDNDDDEELTRNPNGVGARSVSSSVHDRVRSAASASGNLSSASTPTSRTKEHHTNHHRPSSQSTGDRPGTNEGPGGGTARETFLNYFFGTQGPATGPSSTILSNSSRRTPRAAPTDILGDEPSPEQDMGKVAAFDMKSLNKHIETVSASRCSYAEMLMFLRLQQNRQPYPLERKWKLLSSVR
jgi:dynamin 1-like protein